MKPEDQLSRRFEELRFSDEPPMASDPADDVRRGTRRLRRRRAMVLVPAVASVAAAVTGVALALPPDAGAERQLQVTGSGDPKPTPTHPLDPKPTPTHSPAPTVPDDGFEFPATRQHLLEAAVEHLDPKRQHLPGKTSNVQTGGGGDSMEVGTKLDWTIPGEDGTGMVQVLVTTPGYAKGDPPGCWNDDRSKCTERQIPETSETVWVAQPDPEFNLRLGVHYERPDGSVVGIGVYDLFGNNSTTPVSDVDIELKQAFAFVTDPDLRVDPDEMENYEPMAPVQGARNK